MNNLMISQLTLRKLIGIMGLALAAVCLIGGLVFSNVVMPSISAYYHSNMRDIMVGVLSISGAFLLTYKGYSKFDNIISSFAGGFAILVGLFPCNIVGAIEPSGFLQIPIKVSGIVHLSVAASFFALLFVMSYFLFTKTSGNMTEAKKKRNVIYRVSGLTILGNIIVLFASRLFFPVAADSIYLTLILEAIMLVAFGVSWLVKGEAILKDG